MQQIVEPVIAPELEPQESEATDLVLEALELARRINERLHRDGAHPVPDPLTTSVVARIPAA